VAPPDRTHKPVNQPVTTGVGRGVGAAFSGGGPGAIGGTRRMANPLSIPRPAPADKDAAEAAKKELAAPTPAAAPPPPAVALREMQRKAAEPMAGQTPAAENSAAESNLQVTTAAGANRMTVPAQTTAKVESVEEFKVKAGALGATPETAAGKSPLVEVRVDGTQTRPAIAGELAKAPLRHADLRRVNARWQLGPGGTIQHSTDAGKSWQVQASGVTADLLAGNAPTPEICWAVGRRGTILRTSDAGEQWEIVNGPEMTGHPAPEWTRVAAKDALHAQVWNADGQSYVTEDGGKTWQAAEPHPAKQ
ncbi:MAG: WD40/YVTN/BNR-like repeat-containing protein, partial [Bryobacteraceae bacterium]